MRWRQLPRQRRLWLVAVEYMKAWRAMHPGMRDFRTRLLEALRTYYPYERHGRAWPITEKEALKRAKELYGTRA